MRGEINAAEAVVSQSAPISGSQVILVIASICLVWYIVVTLVSTLGYAQMYV